MPQAKFAHAQECPGIPERRLELEGRLKFLAGLDVILLRERNNSQIGVSGCVLRIQTEYFAKFPYRDGILFGAERLLRLLVVLFDLGPVLDLRRGPGTRHQEQRRAGDPEEFFPHGLPLC